MSKQPIQNPHDALFKEMFSKTETARSFFENYLPDDWMAFRLLRYIVRIWEQFRKNNPKAKKLPPILPVVLFQGGARWRADPLLSGLIDPPDELAQYQPEFRHLLVDLGNYDLTTLRGNLLVRAVILAMKMATTPNEPVLETLFDQLNEILEIRFHSVSYSIKALIEQVEDTDRLRHLNRLAVQVDSLADFEQKMNASA